MHRDPLRLIVASLLVGALLVLGAAPARANAQTSPAAVTIADPAGPKQISIAELTHWLAVARAQDAKRSLRFLQHQMLGVLLSIAWIDGEAREQGVVVTDAEVAAELEREKRTSFSSTADYRRFLRRSKQTEADLLLRVRHDLQSARIRDRIAGPAGAAVTGADVDVYLQANGPEERPEQRDLRVVLTRTRAPAQRARRALDRGQSWSAVARRYSIDPTSRRNGGLLPRQAKGTLDEDLDRAVFRARRGRVVGPIKTQYGYFVVEVIRIRPPVVIPAEKHRAQVRAQLVSQAQQAALDAFTRDYVSKWKQRTACAPAFDWFVDCGNWDGTREPGPRLPASSPWRDDD
jgi:foldase protein PrsA